MLWIPGPGPSCQNNPWTKDIMQLDCVLRKPQTKRCMGDCGCEQKYKWHRLLAYDPDNDCKGIFMDWFLFPACCVCRCAPMFSGQ